MVHEDRDTALLSLLKSFLESGPQLILQLYILVKRNEANAVLGKSRRANISPGQRSQVRDNEPSRRRHATRRALLRELDVPF